MQMPSQLNISVTELVLENQPNTVFEDSETARYDRVERAAETANA